MGLTDENFKGLKSLDYVPDMINILNPDMSVYFLNKAACSFYNEYAALDGKKKCYELLKRNKKCYGCAFESCIKKQKTVSKDIYIQELNKFVNVSFKPIFDSNGKLTKILERSIDFTDKEVNNKRIKNKSIQYLNMLNRFPMAAIMFVDNKIMGINKYASIIIGMEPQKVIGRSIYSYLNIKDQKKLHKKIRNLINDKKINCNDYYNFNLVNGKNLNVSVSSSYFNYKGHSAVISVLRDITDEKKELDKASLYQKNSLELEYQKDKINIKKIYFPSRIVSGDFYKILKIDKDTLIGILVDVKGKGVSAALNISAFDILYMQEIKKTNDPLIILNDLNKKLIKYYTENYIAACSFSIDYKKKEFIAACAGMNSFIYKRKDKKAETVDVPGAFLGMFPDSEFSKKVINFNAGDRFYLFTDGMDFILDDIIKRYLSKVSIDEFIKYLKDYIEDLIIEEDYLKDDCTFIGMEIL